MRTPLAVVAPRIVGSDLSIYFDGAVVDMRKTRIRGSSAVRSVSISPEGCSAVIDGERRPVMPWLTGACLAFGIETYRRTAGIDESFFLYWEDVDFCFRARAAGATLIIRHDLQVVHDEGGTQGARRGRAKSASYYYFNCRNRLMFAVKHIPRRQLLRWIALTPGASWSILMQGGRRQLLHSPRVLSAAFRGSVVGVFAAVCALAAPSTNAPGTPPRGRLRLAAPQTEVAEP